MPVEKNENDSLAFAFQIAQDLGLLEGISGQTNRNTLMAAAQHADSIANALYYANNASLLKGPKAQANFDALVTSAQYAYGVANALYYINKAGLLEDSSAQANRDALVAAARHAKVVAEALELAYEAGLLKGSSAQANRDALVVVAPRARDVAAALDTINKAGLLKDPNAQANRDALVVTAKNTECIDFALKEAYIAGLLDGDSAQANFNALLAAANDAYRMVRALKLASTTDLLKGSYAQANRNALVTAVRHVDLLFLLDYPHKAGLLHGLNAQANFDALMTVVEHGLTIKFVFKTADRAGLMSDEQKQDVFNTVLNIFKQTHGNSENQMGLFKVLENYPLLLNFQTFRETLKLDSRKADRVRVGLEILECNNLELLSLAHYQLLLNAGEEAPTVAKILTGELSEQEFTRDNLSKVKLSPEELWQNNLQFPTKTHYSLYQRLSKAPHLFTIEQLAGLVQLSAEQADRLLHLTDECAVNSLWERLFLGEPQELLVHILAEQYLITHLYHQIPQETRTQLPRAQDYESSMRDDYIKLSRERIEVLRREVQFDPTTLEQVEIQIRGFLLNSIKAELEEEGQHKEQIAFIETHGEVLALRQGIPSELVAKALDYFSSTTSANQTAWRAYEPTAAWIHWPNLLTAPDSNSALTPVFSTRASADVGGLTQKSASLEVRTWSAICFLASQKHPEMQQDFIYSLAEIRRAHNTHASEIDNPSCQPGTLSRFLTAMNKHPQFCQQKASGDTKKVIEEVLSHVAQSAVDELSKARTGRDARSMLTALHLYSPQQNQKVLKDKSFIEHILIAKEEDLEASDALNLLLARSQQLRQQIMHRILSKTGAKVYDVVVNKLIALNLPHHPEELTYLIAKHLANLPGLISLPQSLLVACQETTLKVSRPQKTKTELFEQALLHEFAAEIHQASDNGQSLKAAITDLADLLHVHLMRLDQNDYSRTHESVVQAKFKVLERPAVLTLKRVCNVLDAMWPSQVRYQEGQMRHDLIASHKSKSPEEGCTYNGLRP